MVSMYSAMDNNASFTLKKQKREIDNNVRSGWVSNLRISGGLNSLASWIAIYCNLTQTLIILIIDISDGLAIFSSAVDAAAVLDYFAFISKIIVYKSFE